MGLREWCEVAAGLSFLAGLGIVGCGLALFTLNIAFSGGFAFLPVVFFGFVLALAGKAVLNLLVKKALPLSVVTVPVKAASTLCQYCGKVPESNTKCVNCGGVPFAEVKHVD